MSQWWSWGSEGDKSSRCAVDSSTQPDNSQQGPWPQHPFYLFLQPPRVHTALCTYASCFISTLQSPSWLFHPPAPHGSRVLKKHALRLKALNISTFIYLCFFIYIYIFHICRILPASISMYLCIYACLVVTGASRGHHRLGTGGTGSCELPCGYWESSGTAVNALNHCTISRQPSSNF